MTPNRTDIKTQTLAWEGLALLFSDQHTALTAIADMKVDASTDHAQLSALCITIARTALDKTTP